ncbi:MAG: SUMF1/EgtB/PvdO family nonheme iron enzyme [Pseudomonadota bacterium]
MKKITLIASAAAFAMSLPAFADEVPTLNTFVGGQPALASEVNDNFSDVADAVNDNDARINTLITDVAGKADTSELADKADQSDLNTTNTNVTTLDNQINAVTTGIADRVTALESAGGCPADMAAVGPICVDLYEATIWTAASGGTLIADADDPNGDASVTCENNGFGCHNEIFAQSVSGQTPADNITWFQAAMACANSGKRLLTNAEWQVAATGTDPVDGGSCNSSGTIANTGASAGCESSFGVFDMAGNVNEWVADWIQGDAGTSVNANTNAAYGQDRQAGVKPAGAQGSGSNMPAAIYRGGSALDTDTRNGVHFFGANAAPAFEGNGFGFRCAM